MAKDDKKGIYEEAEVLGVKGKNIPHEADSVYERAEKEGIKTVENQDSFMNPKGEAKNLEEKFQKKFAAKGCEGCDCNDPKFLDDDDVKSLKEEGIYEEAKELGRKERVKPAETDSIYKEAEILGERTKEAIDDFMAEPEKK